MVKRLHCKHLPENVHHEPPLAITDLLTEFKVSASGHVDDDNLSHLYYKNMCQSSAKTAKWRRSLLQQQSIISY